MKTTVDLPNDLVRRAKAEAALRGLNFNALVEAGLHLVLAAPRAEPPELSLGHLMKSVCGIVNSGIPDLGSNPKRMKGFGRAPRRDR